MKRDIITLLGNNICLVMVRGTLIGIGMGDWSIRRSKNFDFWKILNISPSICGLS